jgi:arylsulfatase A-like enzyme
MIVRAPGKKSSPGSATDVPVNSNDILPTATEFAGLKPKLANPVDGVSLLAAVAGEKTGNDRPLYWHYPHYGNQGGSPSAAVRRGDWKLIHFFEDDRRELYNLADDIGEDKNVAESNPEIQIQLSKLLDDWSTGVGAKFPTKR